MSDDDAHEIGMAEQAMLSATASILILATDPGKRERLNANDIARSIERLQDALVLTRQMEAA